MNGGLVAAATKARGRLDGITDVSISEDADTAEAATASAAASAVALLSVLSKLLAVGSVDDTPIDSGEDVVMIEVLESVEVVNCLIAITFSFSLYGSQRNK